MYVRKQKKVKEVKSAFSTIVGELAFYKKSKDGPNFVSVSYTHLDVYKRQERVRVFFS